MPEFEWQFTLVLLTNGVMIGLMYALIALGFVLIYKATDAINFAQGEFVMFAGFLAAGAAELAGAPFWVSALLSVAGFAIDRFVFEGFLPQREGRRRRRLEALRTEQRTIVLYESPHHIGRALGEIQEILGDRAIVVGRELTKLFEEIQRGSVSSVRAAIAAKAPRGEYTLAIAGADALEEGSD